jgi:hypothetical protein
MRHRNYVYLLVLLVPVLALIGGLFNDTSAHGRILDETTGEPVAGVQVIYGIRVVLTGADGTYTVDHLPRGARLAIQARGYDPANADVTTSEVSLHPFSMSLQVNEADSGESPKPVAKPEIRQGDTRVGGPGTDAGSVVAAPYPAVGSSLLICAPDHDTLTIEARGGAATPRVVALTRGVQGCPPLPSPSPTPTPLPTASSAPTVSPTPPAPTPTPSPSKSP